MIICFFRFFFITFAFSNYKCMEKTKVLFITQEITPYLPESEMSKIGRYLPQGIQEKGKEIRAFMPRYGLVNERRNQLHDVIRLSGMNIIIDDTDHSLLIKVASIQSARMQVYFIDNEDYFQRKGIFADKENNFYKDNDERIIFYSRGVLETIKKLRWSPDIIHCHGWISSLVPLYIKKVYVNNPLFQNSKVIYSVYNDEFTGELNPQIRKKIVMKGITEDDTQLIDVPNYLNMNKLAVSNADAVIYGSEQINSEVDSYIKESNVNTLTYKNEEEYVNAYSDFYEALLEG